MTKKELILKIKNASPNNDEQFRQIIAAVLNNDFIEETKLRNLLMVSRPTLNRWKNGESVPHTALRPRIFKWLAEQLNRLDAV